MTITNRRDKTHTESRDPAWIEWTTGLVSAILVIALIGWLATEAVTEDDAPPKLSVTVNHIERTGELYRADFSLVNEGPTTAAAVRVVGTVSQPGTEPEEAEVTFDYAPGQSKSDGTLYFRNDPAAGTLTIAPSGYTEP